MAVKWKDGEPTVRMLWGLAKSAELQLTDEELHLVIQAQTGKESMRTLTPSEIKRVAFVLRQMKDSAKRGRKKDVPVTNFTSRQIQKIHALERELGWENPARLSGFCRRMFRIDNVQWLNYQQCSKLIEAMKKMLERSEKLPVTGGEADEELQSDADSQE